MEILYGARGLTVAEVRERMADPPGYSAVRSLLRILEEKGHVRHESDGLRYVYLPTVARHAARRAALRHLVETFFDGSAASAVTALLGRDAGRLTDEDLDRIDAIVQSARKEVK